MDDVLNADAVVVSVGCGLEAGTAGVDVVACTFVPVCFSSRRCRAGSPENAELEND